MELFEPLIISGCIFLSVLSAYIFLNALSRCVNHCINAENYNCDSSIKVQELNNNFIYYKGKLYEKKD